MIVRSGLNCSHSLSLMSNNNDVEKQQEARQPATQESQSWFMQLFQPGVGMGVINFARLSIIAVMIFLVVMTFVHYSIHWIIMSIITLCLFFSFEFFVSELKKDPEFMAGKDPHVDASKESQKDETKDKDGAKNEDTKEKKE